ncbi:hypothetical protein H7I41_10950 [Mycobacterium manitobense]|uniref:Uncharacterized protein n=1 Tax=[Mycobacterium] manitobense TaxID=190147 RepID=A0A9X3BWH2_9MYCO|nr:hypothetical protein [[Mycobacterium] manitobense]MCV7170432.1 hypothetical protein [[Mycobacterium] manitobense]
MDTEREEYWRVTEYVLDLSSDLILRREIAMRTRFALLATFCPEVLLRVINNIGAVGCIQLDETYDLNVSGQPGVVRLLQPFDLLPGADSADSLIEALEETALALRRVSGATGDRVRGLPAAAMKSPSTEVLQSMMPVVASLISTCVSLEPLSAFSAPALEAKLAIVLGFIRCRHVSLVDVD